MGCWLIHPKTLKEAQSQHRGLQQEAPAKQVTTPRAKTQGVPEEGGPGTWAQRGRGGGAGWCCSLSGPAPPTVSLMKNFGDPQCAKVQGPI